LYFVQSGVYGSCAVTRKLSVSLCVFSAEGMGLDLSQHDETLFPISVPIKTLLEALMRTSSPIFRPVW
jgi:hypothetical protein